MRLSLAVPFLAVCAAATGCLADPPPPAAPKAEAPAEKLEELTAKDCVAWADHFASRLKEATFRRIDGCAKQIKAAGGDPAEADAMDLKVANDEAERLRELIVDQCSQQVGGGYSKADAKCYLGAKQMEDWKRCDFESAFFADYKLVAQNHEKLFTKRCEAQMAKTKGASKSGG